MFVIILPPDTVSVVMARTGYFVRLAFADFKIVFLSYTFDKVRINFDSLFQIISLKCKILPYDFFFFTICKIQSMERFTFFPQVCLNTIFRCPYEY